MKKNLQIGMNSGWVPLENKKLTWESEYDANSKAGPIPFIWKYEIKHYLFFSRIWKNWVFRAKKKNMDKCKNKICKEI